jgi:transposase-like protein
MGIRRKNVTQKQRHQILKLLEEGNSVKQVARQVSLSVSEIYKIRREDRKNKASQEEQALSDAAQLIQDIWNKVQSLIMAMPGLVSGENKALQELLGAGRFQVQEKTGEGACETPIPWIDVAQLASWGISRRQAPAYLAAWRQAHESGWHAICGWYIELVKNLQDGVPFADAYHIAYTSWLGTRWRIRFLSDLAALMKLYHPWKGGTNRRFFMEEVRKASILSAQESNRKPFKPPPEHYLDFMAMTAHEAFQLINYGAEVIKRYRRWNLTLWRPNPGPPVGLLPYYPRRRLSKHREDDSSSQKRSPLNPRLELDFVG